MRFKRNWLVVFGLTLLFGTVRTGFSSTVTWNGLIRGDEYCYDNCQFNSYIHVGSFSDSSLHSLSGYAYGGTPGGVVLGGVSGMANYGFLRGSATTYDGTWFQFEMAADDLNLQFTDTLTPMSSILPPGTPAEFLLTFTLLDSWSNGGSASGCYISSAANCADTTATFNGVQIQDSATVGPPPSRTRSFVLNSAVGQNFDLNGTLSLSLVTCESGYAQGTSAPCQGGAGSISAEPGAFFHVQSLTPGVNYVSQSGHDYSPVPEPGTVVLLGMALLGLAPVLRRRLL